MNERLIIPLSEQERAVEVTRVLQLVQPAMQADGGGCQLVNVNEEGIVTIQFEGTCLFCPSQKLTLNSGIALTLKAHLPWVKEVVKASATCT